MKNIELEYNKKKPYLTPAMDVVLLKMDEPLLLDCSNPLDEKEHGLCVTGPIG